MTYALRARARRTLLALTIVLTLGVIAAASAFAQAAPPQAGAAGHQTRATQSSSRYAATIRDARTATQELLDQTGAASMSVALTADGKVVWQQGFGYADKATRTAPGPDTMFGIGSVSKMLAAVATMRLVDQGLVDLDQPVTRYIPTFSMATPSYRQVTVRMLLDHSSGFPGSTYDNTQTDEFWPGYLPYVLNVLADARLKTTPGFLSVYCNDGFTLLEQLIPNVTGKTFAQYVQDEILTPLGMTHSAFPIVPFAAGSFARTYDGDAVLQRETLNPLASGAMYSTPADMSRLATMLMNGGAYGGTRILSSAAVREMAKDQVTGSFQPVIQSETQYGLGWDTVAEPGLAAVGFKGWVKGGDAVNYHCAFTLVPGQRLAVTAVASGAASSHSLEALAQRILLHALVDKGALRRMPAPLPDAAPPKKKATSAQLSAMEGYWAGNSMVFRVAAAGRDPQALDVVTLQSNAWAPMAEGLYLRTDGRFHRKGSAASVYTVAAAGRRYLVNNAEAGWGHSTRDLLLAQKLRAAQPLSSAWQARLGHAWVAASGVPDSALFQSSGAPWLSLGDIPGWPGWLTVDTSGYGLQVVDASRSDTTAEMFLQIPGFGSRDMWDLQVVSGDGEDWLLYGGTVYRPLDTVPALATGANTIDYLAPTEPIWEKVPVAATVTITGGTAWHLFSAQAEYLGGGYTFPQTTHVPAGGYLVLAGSYSMSATATVVPD
jgi:CubicO group peptidase (beta-lactamase class C family)